jgi:hypothetical protein
LQFHSKGFSSAHIENLKTFLVSTGAATCYSTSRSIGSMEVGQAVDAVTGTRRLGFVFPSLEYFDFMLPPASLPCDSLGNGS